MSRKTLTLLCLSGMLCFLVPGQAKAQKAKTSPTFSTMTAPVGDNSDIDADECVTDDGDNTDPGWDLLEKAIPDCKRAVVIFNPNVKLDLGEKPMINQNSNGMNNVKATIVSGEGSYTTDGPTKDLKNLTVWVSLDRCQMRNIFLRDAKDRDVDNLRKARYIVAPQEGLTGILNGDDLKGYQNDCAPAKSGK